VKSFIENAYKPARAGDLIPAQRINRCAGIFLAAPIRKVIYQVRLQVEWQVKLNYPLLIVEAVEKKQNHFSTLRRLRRRPVDRNCADCISHMLLED
jgi:hypothetical protein